MVAHDLAHTHMQMPRHGRNQPLRSLVSTNVSGNKVVPRDSPWNQPDSDPARGKTILTTTTG